MKFQAAQFMLKIKHHLLAKSCMHLIMVSNMERLHDTRNNPYFVSESCRTVAREMSISIYGPRLWNSFPKAIQDAHCISTLKPLLLDFLCSSYIS